MKKNILVLGIGVFFLLASFVYAQEEKITITTYYPSPYGVYNEMQLFPHSTPVTTCDAEHEGTMYFDSDDHMLYVCGCPQGGVCSWNAAGGAGAGFWAASGDDIYNTNTADVKITRNLKVLNDVTVGSNLFLGGVHRNTWPLDITPKSCPEGQFVSALTASGVSGALQCSTPPTGGTGPGPGISPQNCPAGQYVAGIGANGSIICSTVVRPQQTCPAGYFVAGIKADWSLICSAGGAGICTYRNMTYTTGARCMDKDCPASDSSGYIIHTCMQNGSWDSGVFYTERRFCIARCGY